MEANLQVVIEGEEDFNWGDIEQRIDELESDTPRVNIEVSSPKQFLPGLGVGESLTLILVVEATVSTFAQIYPQIRDSFADSGGDTDIINTSDVAIGYIVEHTSASRDQLELEERRISGNYAMYDFTNAGNQDEYHLELNIEDPDDWSFEKR